LHNLFLDSLTRIKIRANRHIVFATLFGFLDQGVIEMQRFERLADLMDRNVLGGAQGE